ncbi:MAG TPA: hypothetical protein VHM91_19635 [Verrucomicrobiales bacterium]|jgi:hypothetical protein|nr:hypothetical protein [Verrucomicrobiales bacterium]
MISFRFPALSVVAVTATACLAGAAEEVKPDKDLPALEARLQVDRASAIRSRLVLYTDELQKLLSQYTTAGDSDSAAAVQEEMKTVQLAVKRLTAIAKGESEPPEAGEAKETSETALAAKRINAIIARFSKAKTDPSPLSGNVPSGQAHQRILKMEKAGRNKEYSSSEGSAYWGYESSFATWSLDNLIPGEYEIILRYTGSKCGGNATVKIGKQSFPVAVPVSDKIKGEAKLTAGIVKITEPGTDIRVQSNGRAKDASTLWNLKEVVLQPVARH